ncbi:hypothetical protein PG984_015144 [Apiospora sp. TS-2023a]
MGFFRELFGVRKKKAEKRHRHRRRRDDSDDDGGRLDPWSEEGIEASLKKHFNGDRKRHGLKYRRIVGQGMFGIAALLQDVRKDPPKSYIIKRAKQFKGIDDLRNEINTLRRLRGAAHITKIVKFKDRGYDETDELPGPYMIVDYLENGSFREFFQRCRREGVRVPNRVLWNILLCFVRACIALTWPLRRGEGAPDEREEIPTQRGPTAAYAHNDLHMGNVMFGNLQPDVMEHEKVPVIKLIDFGAAAQTDMGRRPRDERNFNPLQGHASNVYQLGEMMMRLITEMDMALPNWQPVMFGNAKTDASLLWAPKATERYPFLDERMRQAIGLMMACRYEHRPTLQQLLEMAYVTVRDIRSRNYTRRIRNEETSEGIRAFVNRYVFDADEDDDEDDYY